jgi:Phage terminase, small subunit
MGLRGPTPKSADLRVLEGSRAHRPLPAAGPKRFPGMPERPKGMTAAARRAWDAYSEQLAPLQFLRPVDGFALRRLCEDIAALEELAKGIRRLLADMKREAKVRGEKLRGGAITELNRSSDGRRLQATYNTIDSRIKRGELQFGLTPVSSMRLEGIAMMPSGGPVPVDNLEAKLCG